MIPVRGVDGRRVAVLGLGRSGLSAARALAAGGADVLAWDDSAAARAAAEAEGIAVMDLSRTDWAGVSALVVSPGIPHLYPAPNPVVAAALLRQMAIDEAKSIARRPMSATLKAEREEFLARSYLALAQYDRVAAMSTGGSDNPGESRGRASESDGYCIFRCDVVVAKILVGAAAAPCGPRRGSRAPAVRARYRPLHRRGSSAYGSPRRR